MCEDIFDKPPHHSADGLSRDLFFMIDYRMILSNILMEVFVSIIQFPSFLLFLAYKQVLLQDLA